MASSLPPPPPPPPTGEPSPSAGGPPSPSAGTTTGVRSARTGRWWDVRRWSTAQRWIVGIIAVLLVASGFAAGGDGDSGKAAAIAPPATEPDAADPTTTSTEETTTTTEESTTSTAPTTTEAPTTTAAHRPPTTAAKAPTGTPARVVSVVDGDTVKVDLGGITTSIRIIGIDTPEIVHPNKPVECFGPEASQRAHELLDGQTVGVEYDGTQGRLDRYGRTLAYLRLPDGRLYTSVMLREGFAKEYTYDGPYKHLAEHLDAEQDARANGRGLWSLSTCGGDTDQPDPNRAAPAPSAPPAAPGSGLKVHYKNCAEARAAGAAPIHRGQPGYRAALDRDGDGIACE